MNALISADPCPGCGGPVPLRAQSFPGPSRRWCTDECRIRHRNTQRAKAKRDARLELRAQRPCEQCGADMSGRSPKAKFCSKWCSDVAYGKRLPEHLPKKRCALPECGREFQPTSARQRCCCEAHGKKLWRIEAQADGRIKREPWGDRRRDAYHRRRALKKQASTGNPVLLSEIAKRDKWKCGICRKRVNPKLVWPHPMSPSLDHVVPLTKGGAHDPANVVLAHLVCNTSKGNRGGGEQLALIG